MPIFLAFGSPVSTEGYEWVPAQEWNVIDGEPHPPGETMTPSEISETRDFTAREALRTASRFYDRAASYLAASESPELAELQRLIAIRFFEPSIRLNRDATEAARERARQAVPVVKAEVLKGERVVGAHEQIRDAELERLRAYQDALAALGALERGGASLGRAAGAFLSSGVRVLIGALMDRIPSTVRGASSGLPGYPVSFSPALAFLTQSLTSTLFGALLLAATRPPTRAASPLPAAMSPNS